MGHLVEQYYFENLQGFDPSSYLQIFIDLELELEAYSLNMGQMQISRS